MAAARENNKTKHLTFLNFLFGIKSEKLNDLNQLLLAVFLPVAFSAISF